MQRLNRRQFGMLAAGAAAVLGRRSQSLLAAETKDVPWLAEIQMPPRELPTNAPQLSPLLASADGKPIRTLEDWQARRAELRQWWLEFLGPLPAERKQTPKLKVVEEDRVGDVVRQLVQYEVEPGIMTEAYICLPAKIEGKLPGIVAFHSTVDHSIRQPAGVEGAPEKAFGLLFAQRGRIVICPRNYLWPQTKEISAKGEAERFLARRPKSKGMAKMLYDGLVAVDILASLPEVDAARLGAVGHSLGAKEVIYQAAFDERIKVAVSSEGGVGTKFSNWDAPWYLGPTIQEPAFTHEHHELLALAAPRPFLLIGGESADGDRGWPFIAAALPVYKLYGGAPRIGQLNHRQGHAVPPVALERIEEWFATYL